MKNTNQFQMTKKCEPSLIDLMDDIDSVSADALKTKAWKHLAEKGPVFQVYQRGN